MLLIKKRKNRIFCESMGTPNLQCFRLGLTTLLMIIIARGGDEDDDYVVEEEQSDTSDELPSDNEDIDVARVINIDEELAKIHEDLEHLRKGTHSFYQSRLAKLDDEYAGLVKRLGFEHVSRLDEIEECFQLHQAEERRECIEQIKDLRKSMIAELERTRQQMLDSEDRLDTSLQDELYQEEQAQRTRRYREERRRRGDDDTGVRAGRARKRAKEAAPDLYLDQSQLMLTTWDINDDWKQITKTSARPRKPNTMRAPPTSP